jgi:hypothetical protein
MYINNNLFTFTTSNKELDIFNQAENTPLYRMMANI